MEPIQFTGVSELKEVEQEIVNKLSTEYYDKIARKLQNITSLLINVKTYEKGGKAVKYSIHIKAVAPTKTFTSDKADDYDLAKALHVGFNKVMNMIEHHQFKE